ncbi:MAG: hypothetical protein C4576_15030 [Desulfobacteraceae bacterium]|nr:MAG: hypothetical protein C4576_15030 [Desulfobacteraceae bacterium]
MEDSPHPGAGNFDEGCIVHLPCHLDRAEHMKWNCSISWNLRSGASSLSLLKIAEVLQGGIECIDFRLQKCRGSIDKGAESAYIDSRPKMGFGFVDHLQDYI